MTAESRARRLLGGLCLAALLVTGCGHGGTPQAGSAAVPTEGSRPPDAGLPQAAEPRQAPPPTDPVLGRTVSVGRSPEGIVVDPRTRTVAVAVRDPDQLVLLDADTGAVTGRVPLPGSVRHLQLAAPGGPVLVPVETADVLIRVDLPQGKAQPAIHTGEHPHDAAAAANGTVFVANEHGGTVAVVRGDQVVKIFADSVQPAGTAPVGTAMGVLDVRKNDLTVYDAERLTIVGSAPAGAGPTHLLADRHGRMIAADTRGDAVRVFTPLPVPREVATVAQPGGPYGITYDAARDRLWVASSGTNEVVGYDMSDTNPREVRRFPTVQNPYTVGVDANSGRLFVAGVTAGVVQIIEP
ncbi:YncE family protein [Mycobacterium sp. TY815]|uniref:YncE family protein n=1 Tax=Mycobacterium sp. TY815 TaxID=3050581 RepID=UPI002740B898|nr:YncE family protein [Mycobacterium sp. TY815]MDP7703086.1 YncE family protein [Mycobacterium sp. TY815]